ncbi:MAG: hypothetical protein K8R36_20740 [Planctomycetales bacterium]|nr:hypothetical protein [Planctomycetales bacterium]
MAAQKVARPLPTKPHDELPVMNFKNHYRSLFKSFGYPLKPSHALPASVISKAEKRLGIKVCPALRDYYLVAGRERRFNQCHNHLLPPTEWRLEKKLLLFLEENQWVVFWGVPIANPQTKDPPVYTAVNDEPLVWHREHTRTSGFLAHMLHYHAVSGGMPFRASCIAPQTRYRMQDHGWKSYGKINNQYVYSRQGQIIFLAPSSLPFIDGWMIDVAASSKEGLKNIQEEMGLEID